ncbi:MAG: glycosyltransferase family 39 protein [Acidimicrobiales bacterium]|nr:glycosyltransferase family 39 protein [Acidimicrobiales bacterium]
MQTSTSPSPCEDLVGVQGLIVRRRWLVFVLAAVLFMAIGLHQGANDAPTVDEGVDISSGVAVLVRRDLRMNPEHPPLPKVLAAFPALLAKPIVPQSDAWERGDWFDWSDDFISANHDAGRLDNILLYGRAVVLLEAVACGALIMLFAGRWFGPLGGLFSGVMWLATPYVVGIGHFAMLDIAFTLASLGIAYLAMRWRESPSTIRLVGVAVALGLALATRHTALVLALYIVVIVAEHYRHDVRSTVRDVGLISVVSLVVVWVIYRGLSPGGSSPAVQASFDGLVAQGGASSVLSRLVGALPLPLEWRAGFAYLEITSVPRPASLLGRSWDGAVWWYFPLSALMKIPFTIVAGIVVGWVLSATRQFARRDLLRFVVGPALALWLFLLAQPLNLGLRLALPTVAFAYIGLGALTRLNTIKPQMATGAIAVIVLVGVSTSILAAPHSLAWNPWPWTPGYQWVSDSNIDAGQALYEVRNWAETKDQPYVAVDTTRGMHVGGGSRSLTNVEPQTVRGWVAVGVTPLMQTRRDNSVWASQEKSPPPGFSLGWLRKYCPVGTLGGGAILLYHFDEAPDPSLGPQRPVAACTGAEASYIP